MPGVRGVEQSRPKESIRQEMVELAAAGYREVGLRLYSGVLPAFVLRVCTVSFILRRVRYSEVYTFVCSRCVLH